MFASFDKETLPESRPLCQKERIFDFLSVRSSFISPNERQKQYFHEWSSHDNTTFGVNERNENLSYTVKVKFCVSFML